MRIKYWLMLTYLIVMLLPLAGAYILYLLVSSYDEHQDLQEYLAVTRKITELEKKLENPSLYYVQPVENYSRILGQPDPSLKIVLYRYDGVTLYSSLEDNFLSQFIRTDYSIVMRNLYELRKSDRTYSLKKPVFKDNRMLGIYEITIVRQNWIDGVWTRSVWLAAVFGVFFILLYLVAVWLLHRKLNRPITLLIKRMAAFAAQEKMPELVHHTKDEIGELINQFEKMKSKIEQSQQEVEAEQREKGYIVASLSHDLKTPLTSIRAYAEALYQYRDLNEQERIEYISILFDKIDYMKQILDDLTVYTALRSSTQEQMLVEVDGQEFFDMLFDGYEELSKRKGVNLSIDIWVNDVYHLHEQQMIRLVDNLMSNALRYTDSGHFIHMAAISFDFDLPSWIFPPFQEEVEEWRQGNLVLLFQNEGKAIPEEHLPYLLEPFYQADPSRTQTTSNSSGLGLSIAKSIMEKHGGDIRIWSASPYGTTVVCRIKPWKG